MALLFKSCKEQFDTNLETIGRLGATRDIGVGGICIHKVRFPFSHCNPKSPQYCSWGKGDPKTVWEELEDCSRRGGLGWKVFHNGCFHACWMMNFQSTFSALASVFYCAKIHFKQSLKCIESTLISICETAWYYYSDLEYMCQKNSVSAFCHWLNLTISFKAWARSFSFGLMWSSLLTNLSLQTVS